MNIKNVDSLSFSAKTDKGNDYKKSTGGKLSGFVVGTLFLGSNLYRSSKSGEFKQLKLGSIKKGTTAPKLGLWVVSATVIYSLLIGFGAVIDAVVNKVRKNQADKTAIL